MLRRILLLASLVGLLAACDSAVSELRSEGGKTELSLRGEGARGVAAGKLLEIRDHQVWLDGRALGQIKAGQTVRYTVEGEKRVLTVDGVVLATEGGGGGITNL